MDAIDMEVLDIDRVNNDPAEGEKLLRLLDAAKRRKNTILLSEFDKKYSSIFNKEEASKINMQELRAMSKEYISSIDPYSPVYVVRSMNAEPLYSNENLVYTLPPIYNRVGVVNQFGKDGTNIMQAFNNIVVNSVDDRFDVKKAKFSKSLSVVFQNMGNEQQRQENIRQAKAMSDAIVNQQPAQGNTQSSSDVQEIPADMLNDLGISSQSNSTYSSTETEEFL